MQAGEPERGTLASVKALGATFLALVRTRIELAVVELREEAERKKEALVLGAVAGVFLAMAALLFAFFIVVVFWDTHRIAASAGVTLAYLGIGVVALLRLKRIAGASPPPFEATLAELAKDVEALGGNRE
jgi:uncharacterized membrane protein YqjE